MTKQEIIKEVKTIIIDQLGIDEENVKPESNIRDDLGADSLDEVEIIMSIEREFDIEISDEAAEKIETVTDAVAHISRLLS